MMINNQWLFGDYARIDFGSGVPVVSNDSKMGTHEGCACISDAQGNLLFYTDGVSVWDGQHQERITGLRGHDSSTQSAIIVPDPGAPGYYYVFTTKGFTSKTEAHLAGVRFNITDYQKAPVDLSALDVEGMSPTERLTAVAFGDCAGYWVITLVQTEVTMPSQWGGRAGTGIMRVLRVDAQGVTHAGDYSLGDTEIYDNGYLRVKPDNSELALGNSILKNIILLHFDTVTGVPGVNQQTRIDLPELPMSMTDSRPNSTHVGRIYGVEYSPSGRYLYYSVKDHETSDGVRGKGYVYQVDLNTLQQQQLQQVLVGVHENKDKTHYSIGAIQKGPDDVLYITQSGESSLAAILQPEQAGTACDLRWDHLPLAEGSRSRLGLPNLLSACVESDVVVPVTHSPCSCGTCHDKTAEDVALINERARAKAQHELSGLSCNGVFPDICTRSVSNPDEEIAPCFVFHWGDGPNDQIEARDSEIFYLTAQNPYNDMRFEGLRITAVRLVPDPGFDEVSIVPDRLVEIGCLEPCQSQSREFAIITWDRDSKGSYQLQVDYCFEKISLTGRQQSGTADFPLEIVED